jgi:tetratricopeptide (TPR) repeat protein
LGGGSTGTNATKHADVALLLCDVMISAVLALGLFVAPVAFDAPGSKPSLAAQAAASGRPKECQVASNKRAKKISVWQRVRFPKLAPYCEKVAKSHALLESDPQGALDAAVAADKEWSGRPGAAVAKGRALLALGKADEALAAFEAAKKIDESAVEDPKAMRDHARALIAKSRARDAAAVYRVLVPRAELLPSALRSRTLLEAAFASMTAEAETGAPNPDAKLAEALAFLDEIRQREGSPLAAEATLASALVHDRRGDATKASGLAAEAVRGGVDATENSWVADPADRHVLRALALEPVDPNGASEVYTAYLEAAKSSPYAPAARARQAALKKRGSAPAKKPKKGAK